MGVQGPDQATSKVDYIVDIGLLVLIARRRNR